MFTDESEFEISGFQGSGGVYFQEPPSNTDALNNLKNEARDFQNIVNKMKDKIGDFGKALFIYKILANNIGNFIELHSLYLKNLNQELSIQIQGTKQNNSEVTSGFMWFLRRFLSQIRSDVTSYKSIIKNGKSYIKIEIENTLSEIENALREILDNNNQNYSFLKYLLDKVKNEFWEKLGENFKNLKQVMLDCIKNQKFIEEQLAKLKVNTKKFMEIYQQSKINRSTAFENMKNLIDTDISKLKDFKTVNLSERRGQAEHGGVLVQKNWNETVKIYDNYDEHDIKYTLQAVLDEGCLFTSFPHYFSFYPSDKFKIVKFEIDGENAQYDFNESSRVIEVQKKIESSQEFNIHLVYIKFQDISELKLKEKKKKKLKLKEDI